MRFGHPERRPGTRSLRQGRFSGQNQIYHINTATIDRNPIFQTLALGRQVVRAMRREDEGYHSRTLAFVVMPDHLHWLLQLVGNRPLSGVVNTMKSFSSRRINAVLGESGSVWQKGYYDHAMRREEDLKAVARYIIANPVRAGLVGSVRQYSLWDAEWV